MSTRKRFRAGTAVLVAALTTAVTPLASAAPPAAPESAQLAALYENAKREGGTLTVYAGGDVPRGQDAVAAAFGNRFPGLKVDIKVDLSKDLVPRIDNELARGDLKADIAHIQLSNDLERWKREGRLLRYKPVGWDRIYPQFKDDGYITGMNVFAFANVVRADLPNPPVEARDYLRPELKDKLVLTYPNDDDAVLWQFQQLVAKYGWGYFDALRAQNPNWIRGTRPAANQVAAGAGQATFTAVGALNQPAGSTVTFSVPKQDRFLSWAQSASILKQAKHPETAKLYLSWLSSKEYQDNSLIQWSVRDDVRAKNGWGTIFDYPNTDPTAFPRWLRDRAEVERFRNQITHYLGAPKGDSPTKETFPDR
ncbi:ABC-type Fe3+ transport system substrate-binding protein [Crossiella equi]|uniref:ABC-type Fe3+ transport system substrate-binding protein n=1 Tax=Crossiella equi TaxID=130796 RepID=A0ABS5AQR0_9PSEU|nr:extracellular solute-binding protein [Crossiella equi]MBP2478909.1 ABC-type Fe3+ transport system substrate-binding protein [Crossiella equi]